MTKSDVKAVAFDVDGTLVRENFWTALNRMGGIPEEEDRRLGERYAEGELAYRDWMEEIARSLRRNSHPRDEVEKMLARYRLVPGARDVVEHLSRFPLALVSSNIDLYVADVARKLGISHAYGYCRIEYDERGLFAGIGFRSDKDELEHKVEALRDFATKSGVSLSEIAFVGDSRNDLAAFTATGRGILVGEGNEDLRRAAWKRVATLSEILKIL
ncbi:MAG: HAD-IB family phosphatase [Patescibacteria group bacterium]